MSRKHTRKQASALDVDASCPVCLGQRYRSAMEARASYRIRGNDLQNLVDGVIHLPDGETVTGHPDSLHQHGRTRCEFQWIQKSMLVVILVNEYGIDYNNEFTNFSDASLFNFEDGKAIPVSLAAGAY